jgi:hypothetical protein
MSRFACLLIATGGSVAEAQVQLDRFDPAATSIGAESTIKAEGKFPTWPPQIVCDRPDVKLTALEKSGELQVHVDPDAAPGVAWIRLHDETSASSLVPLMIESAAVTVEKEPNQRLAEATEIASPTTVCGRLEKSGDVDTFRIAARSGQTLVVSMIANQVLRSPMDGVLQLVDDRGNVLFQVDDQRGLDPQLVFPISQDGDYLIRVFAFPETPNSTIGYAGGASFVYALRVSTETAVVDHFIPLVGGDETAEVRPVGWHMPEKTEADRAAASAISPPILYVRGSQGWQWQEAIAGSAGSIFESILEPLADGPPRVAKQVPFLFSGHVLSPGEIDRIRFPVTKGSQYRVRVESKRLGYLLDSVLRLVDPQDGSELKKNDDSGRNDYDASVDIEAKEDGEIELQISDAVDGFGIRHAYSVVVEQQKPSVSLELSADHYQVHAGEELELPVSVNRLNGFDQRLEIVAEELPQGLQATAAISEPKGETAKSVKLKLTAETGVQYQGEFRVVAHPVDPDGKRVGDAIPVTFPLREMVRPCKPWLTVAPAKP